MPLNQTFVDHTPRVPALLKDVEGGAMLASQRAVRGPDDTDTVHSDEILADHSKPSRMPPLRAPKTRFYDRNDEYDVTDVVRQGIWGGVPLHHKALLI